MNPETSFINRRFLCTLLALIITSMLAGDLLLAQYKRGAYEKKLLLAIEHDKDSLPKNKKYAFIRSIGGETHAVIWDMNTFTFYIDKDNTTEDTIDAVYSYDPNLKGSLRRVENNFKPGEFQKFKEGIIRSGMSGDAASYIYPGMDDLVKYAEKYKYYAMKSDTGYVIQLKDKDSYQVKTFIAVDSQSGSLSIQNNFDYRAGTWIDSMIIFPAYAKRTTDPTIKKMIEEGTSKISKIISERR